MKFLDAEFVKGFIRMANDGWEQGWHERNGGNLSYRVKSEEVEEVKENFEAREWNSIGTAVPNLAGEYFLVTGSGKYFRNVTIKPEDSICMIELDEKGENYRIVWGLVNGGRPTSELPSHLMNLEVKKLQDERYRVVYHAHTTNVIALTFVLPLEDKVFTRELWEMATECPVVFPSGIGVVPWMVPGVAKYNVFHASVCQHSRGDFACESTFLLKIHIFSTNLDVGAFCSLYNRDDIDGRYAENNVNVVICHQWF